MLKRFFHRYKYQLIIFWAIVVVKTIFNLSLSTLVQVTGADEFGTIAGASYFAGLDWSNVVSHISYYGFGYSVLMAPIFLITDNPVVIFQCMIGLNTFCLAVTGIIAFNIMNDIFKIENKAFSVITAFASALYFGAAMNANAVYNESMITLLGWIVIYILLKMQQRKDEEKSTLALTFVLAFVLVYSLLVHTRGLYLCGAAVIFILTYLVMKRKLLANPIVLVAIGVPGYLATKKLIVYVQKALWMSGGNQSDLNNSVESLGGYFGNVTYLFTKNGLLGFIRTIYGQIFGMITVSGGLFAIVIALILCGTCAVIYCFFKKKDTGIDSKLITMGMFIFSFLGATIGLTALGISDVTSALVAKGECSKWYLYVRYWGMIGGIMTLFGLVAAYKLAQRKAKVIATTIVGTLVVTGLFMWKLSGGFATAKCIISSVYLNYASMGFIGKEDYMTRKVFAVMAVFAIVCLVILLACMWKKKYVVMAVLVCALSLYNYAYTTIVIDKDSSDEFYNEFSDISSEIEKLGIDTGSEIHINVGHTKTYEDKFLDKKARMGWAYDAQFWLNRYKVIMEYPDMSEPGVVVTNQDVDEYKKAGYEVVYEKNDSKLFDGIVILKKDEYMKVSDEDNLKGKKSDILYVFKKGNKSKQEN